jgi:medium-chain acyl-[acyl-carrier-protein] hydrolase
MNALNREIPRMRKRGMSLKSLLAIGHATFAPCIEGGNSCIHYFCQPPLLSYNRFVELMPMALTRYCFTSILTSPLEATVTTPWIIYPKPNPKAYMRLFCFPYAGAGASIFRTWSAQLPPDIEVCSVQLPGRESRLKEPLFTDLAPLIHALTPALLPHLDLPFVFFGHSVGALISFEVARQLRRLQHSNPLHLFISGRQAPQLPAIDPPIHQLPDAEFKEELDRYNGTPRNVLQNVELMDLFLPILRADIAIDETYVYAPEAPLDGSISVFGGLGDGKVSRDSLSAWRDQTYGTFSLRMFPGDHFFLRSQQGALLEAISHDLVQIIPREA